jgi:hypothetical protein
MGSPAEAVDRASLRLRIPVRGRVAKGDICRVYGYASTSVDSDGSLVVDHQGDIIPPDELEAAVTGFLRSAAATNVEHQGPDVGRVIETALITPERLESYGLAIDKRSPHPAPQVGWLVGFEVLDPDAASAVRKGELVELSIEGDAQREPVAKSAEGDADPARAILRNLRVQRVALVRAGAGKGVRIALVKSLENKMNLPENVAAALAGLDEEARAAVMGYLESMMSAEKAEDKPEEEMAKAADPAVVKAREEIAKLRADLAEMREREEIRKYRDELAHLGPMPHLDADAAVKVLRAADAHLDAATAGALRKALGTTAEIAKRGELLGGEVGTVAKGADKGAALDAAAAEIRKSNPNLTREQSIARALRDDPSLYEV